MDALDPHGQDGGPGTAGDPVDAGRKDLVHPAKDAVLFMDHPGLAQKPGRSKGGDRRIAAKAHDHGRRIEKNAPDRGDHAACDAKGDSDLFQRAAAGKGGRGQFHHLDRRGETARIARAARVGGQLDPPAPRQHRLGQRLRRKHVSPRTPRRDKEERRCHPRPRPWNTSPIWPCGRVRVSASNMPMVIPAAMMDDPP